MGAAIQKLDANYLDTFGAGQYQGLTRDHWVELELPDDAPRTGSLYLIGDGFLHPWDDTVTMARSQGSSPAPQDLSIDVPDRAGHWVTALNHLGIPAGRLKTVVFDLTALFRTGAPRKLRLRTTMEVYWDRLAWAAGLPDEQVKTQRDVYKRQARGLAPDNSRIEGFLGLVEAKRGKLPETLAHYEKAVSLDSSNLRALYSWAMETERQQSATSDADAQKLLERVLRIRPGNEAILLDIAHLAAKRNDIALLKNAVAGLGRNTAMWPEPAKQQFARLQQAAAAPDFHTAAIQVQFLRNTLVRVPSYRQSLDEVKAPATTVGEPFLKFLRLPSPSSEPAPPDMRLHFEEQPVKGVAAPNIAWIGSLVLDGEGDSRIVWADATSVHIEDGATLSLPVARGQASGMAFGRYAILGLSLIHI